MGLNKTYKTWDMGFISDSLDVPFDGTHYYTYASPPAWFTATPISLLFPTLYLPEFSFLPPKGTSGTFTIVTEKRTFPGGTLVSSGLITIDLQAQAQAVWNVDHCHTANLVWLDPSGGWESYLFIGKLQATQDKGETDTFVDQDNVTRNQRKEGLHQGTIVSSGKIPASHIDFLADAHKSIQVYLAEGGNVFTPIIIEPQSFKKVKSRQADDEYNFQFRHGAADVIQSQ